jgi:hypothetical protein
VEFTPSEVEGALGRDDGIAICDCPTLSGERNLKTRALRDRWSAQEIKSLSSLLGWLVA